MPVMVVELTEGEMARFDLLQRAWQLSADRALAQLIDQEAQRHLSILQWCETAALDLHTPEERAALEVPQP